jgi:hypothetical protein
MRALIAGALAATLVGCSCYVTPQSGIEACTGADARGFACFDRNAGTRLSQATEPEPASFGSNSTIPTKEKPALAATTAKPSPAHSGNTTRHANKAPKSTPPAAANVETVAAGQPTEAFDPVMDKAKIAVAVKLEDPKSATFSEMNRAMREVTSGQSVDTICGHVKSKTASGEDIGDRTFVYLVKDDEAYVVDGSPTSAASTAYHIICK